MELTVNIKEQSKIAAFLNLIRDMDYIEIVNVKEELHELPTEHKDLLDKRLQRIENGESTFKNWDLIKGKYEDKAL
ncbi:MAG: addiction module protein [Bacteroidales bacterium]|nr:addiction module protein [Bacteroidales bacterium]